MTKYQKELVADYHQACRNCNLAEIVRMKCWARMLSGLTAQQMVDATTVERAPPLLKVGVRTKSKAVKGGESCG